MPALSTHREQNTGDETLWIDSRLPYNLANEVSCTCFYDAKACIQMLCKHIQKHKKQLIINKETTGTKHNVKKWLAHIFQAALPFIENMICFIPFFMINNRVTESAYFARLDCYLLYVLLFAIVYGQQQASFSAILSIGGYFFRQMYHVLDKRRKLRIGTDPVCQMEFLNFRRLSQSLHNTSIHSSGDITSSESLEKITGRRSLQVSRTDNFSGERRCDSSTRILL